MGRGTVAAGTATKPLVSLGSGERMLDSGIVAEKRQPAVGAHVAVASGAVLVMGSIDELVEQQYDQ